VSAEAKAIQKIWRWTMLSFKFVLVAGVVVIGTNIWSNAQQQKPFDWYLIITGISFALFAWFLYIVMLLIFKLVRAKARNDEGRS
jgi:magnesium-transporting ATPase (P-type)